MATFVKRKSKTGETRWTAVIRIKRDGVIVHREAKTFPRKSLASAWAQAREVELAKPGALDRPTDMPTVGKAIRDYVDERQQTSPIGRTKRTDMLRISKGDLGEISLDSLTTPRLIAYARDRRADGVGPSTTKTDLIWIGVLLRYARSAWGLPVDVLALEDAMATLKRERVIGSSRRRDRRPKREELEALDERFKYLQKTQPGIRGSLRLIMWGAIYSARRLDELMSLRLSDYDKDRGRWLVRDIKNPRGSAGNHRWMHVTERFAVVVEDAPKGELLFPYKSKSVGTAWRRELKVLGIADLHFHDLRHEACSRLAEDGCTIPQIQRVSLHDSWSSLQIYVNMGAPDPTRLEYEK